MMPRDPASKHAHGLGTDEPVMQTVNILGNFEDCVVFFQSTFGRVCDFFYNILPPTSCISKYTSSNCRHR